jgi:hypothetical protein
VVCPLLFAKLTRLIGSSCAILDSERPHLFLRLSVVIMLDECCRPLCTVCNYVQVAQPDKLRSRCGMALSDLYQ